ncbi:hypothetical protein CHS0354_037286 [Potamilus streckersoni]|uniref:Uncharacterized protein n=1 Tax=Potamilus streckersoni TaxID=2493646 RepID=A0AAE0SY40_9BIVA|nr:hypothetical protein CHS0354_037286 [Potamilus streckersoni]
MDAIFQQYHVLFDKSQAHPTYTIYDIRKLANLGNEFALLARDNNPRRCCMVDFFFLRSTTVSSGPGMIREQQIHPAMVSSEHNCIIRPWHDQRATDSSSHDMTRAQQHHPALA